MNQRQFKFQMFLLRFCFVVLMLFGWVQGGFGQNLVPNPSFEIHDSCPDDDSEIIRALGWISMNFSPDYLNRCATNWVAAIPTNLGGSQQPLNINDSAFVGIITILNNSGHEIIGINLLDTLVIGQKYYVSFLVSAGYKDSLAYQFTCFCNKIGAKFLTFNPPSIFNPFNFQLINDTAMVYTTSIINDTTNWVMVKGSFIADSAYTFLMIGNFFTQGKLNYTCIDTSIGLHAYTYIDDVCVSTDSLTCAGTTGIDYSKQKESITVYPSPFMDKLNLNANDYQILNITLYDVIGRKFLQQNFSNLVTINTGELAKGIYFYEVSNKSGMIKQGKVIKQ